MTDSTVVRLHPDRRPDCRVRTARSEPRQPLAGEVVLGLAGQSPHDPLRQGGQPDDSGERIILRTRPPWRHMNAGEPVSPHGRMLWLRELDPEGRAGWPAPQLTDPPLAVADHPVSRAGSLKD